MPSPPQGGQLGVLPLPIGLGGSLASGGGLPSAIHFWPMTEGTGTTIVDHIGTTNLTTNALWTATPSGMGASSKIAGFDGTSVFAQASVVDSTLNFSGSTPFTISVWIFPTGALTFTLFGNLTAPTTYEGWELTSGGPTGTGILLVNNITTNQMSALNGIFAVSTAPTLLVVTYDGSLSLAGVKEYVNGTLTPVTDSSGTLSASFTSAVPFLVGKRADNTNFYTGAMSYMRTWNQVLTPTQVSALFALGPQ